MYADLETVPYDSLNSQPNRYNNKQDNIFFVVKAKVMIKIHRCSAVECVLYQGRVDVCRSKYANDKGVIEGYAIIGETMNDPFNADSPLNKRFNAITDGNSRHVKKRSKTMAMGC